MSALQEILLLILGVARFLVIAHVILSLLLSFNVLDPRQPIVRGIWDGLERLFEPAYRRIRAVMPDTRPLDLSPVVLLIGLEIVRILIVRMPI
ncbi:MAG: YggT family protein [Pseudomonadota bacterium]